MNNLKPYAFISYSWDDTSVKLWVKRLSNDLKANGIEVFLDANEVALGDRIESKVSEAIEKADYFIVILTPSYKDKMKQRENWVEREYRFFNGYTQFKKQKKKLIPVLLSGTERTSIPDDMKSIAWIDMSLELEYTTRFEELISSVFPNLKAPSTIGNIPSSIDDIVFTSKHDAPDDYHFEVDHLKKKSNPILIFHGESRAGKTMAMTRFCRYLLNKGAQIKLDLKANEREEYQDYLKRYKNSLQLSEGIISAPMEEFPLIIGWQENNNREYTLLDIPGNHYSKLMAGDNETSYLNIIFRLENERVNLLFFDYRTLSINVDYIYQLSRFIEDHFVKGRDKAIIIISKADLSPHINSGGGPITPRIITEFKRNRAFDPLWRSLKTKGIDSPTILPFSSVLVYDDHSKTQVQSLEYYPKKLWNAIIKTGNWNFLDLLRR